MNKYIQIYYIYRVQLILLSRAFKYSFNWPLAFFDKIFFVRPYFAFAIVRDYFALTIA